MGALIEPTDVGLEAADFQRISEQGFGDGWNSYAHTMAWFREQLFVGTSRGTLAMVRVNDPPPMLVQWPIDSPGDVYQLDRRAEVWRYQPAGGSWERAYRSPMVEGRSGDLVARDIGYRGSAVHQGPGDLEPALYLCTWSSSKGLPPLIMRTADGVEFEELARPSWGDSVNTFRALTSFRGRLFTAPTGATRGYGLAQECVAGSAVVYSCSDPRSGDWVPTCAPGFDNEENVTVFELAVFDDHLYAGTINSGGGFEIWKTRAEGEPPYEWKLVVRNGAWRGPTNQIAVSLCPFGGALYVGSGIINGGYDRRRNIGPDQAEIIRIWPDDTWDLVVGKARLTPDGLKNPISSYAPGFDNFFNGYVWRMAVHRGHLYAGTFKWTALLPYMPLEKWPPELRFMVEARSVEEIVSRNGGFDLWRTADGVTWQPVTRTGFDNPYNWGVRGLVSTPEGLFVGTANPFGPQIAVRTTRGGWKYVPNARGGTEVWLGRTADESGDRAQPRGLAA